MKKILTAALAAIFASPALGEDKTEPSIADLDFFIGEWEGNSRFFYPREPEREDAFEASCTSCKYILKETYIQCDTSWTRNSDQRTRTLRLMLNYNALDEGYQVLYIYDNWPRHVSYLIHYDEEIGAYVGMSDFEDGAGATGKERIEWRVSADGTAGVCC